MDFQGLQNTVSIATIRRTRGMEGEGGEVPTFLNLKFIFQGLLTPGIAGEMYCLGSYMDANTV